MPIICTDVEVNLSEWEMLTLFDESNLKVEDLFDDHVISVYCRKHLAIGDVFYYDEVLSYVQGLIQDNPHLKPEFLKGEKSDRTELLELLKEGEDIISGLEAEADNAGLDLTEARSWWQGVKQTTWWRRVKQIIDEEEGEE